MYMRSNGADVRKTLVAAGRTGRRSCRACREGYPAWLVVAKVSSVTRPVGST